MDAPENEIPDVELEPDPTAVPDVEADEPDDLEGCDIGEHATDDDETSDLRALFPEGVGDDRWAGVFDGP